MATYRSSAAEALDDRTPPPPKRPHLHSVRVRLPSPHPSQEVFVYWPEWFPDAQVLVAPCGTKVGKSFGAALWLAREAMLYNGLFCLWIGPTLEKARIGYRYLKALFPEPLAQCSDSRLEIRLANGTFIKCTHGRDAEVTVEGEAVDRFVMDEAGKQKRQLWHSLITTITQTMGLGIITGTPRGMGWYYEVFRQAKAGDKFFAFVQLATSCSPYVNPKAIENAKRILPPELFAQYYLAQFISGSTVFGDLGAVWFRDPPANPRTKLWLHPNPAEHAKPTVTGVDLAKKRDFTVFITTNIDGVVVGYWRFRGGAYTAQARRLQRYLEKFTGEREVRYDATGVGEGFGDIIGEMDIDASFVPVLFTNLVKQDLVTRSRIAIESDWWHCPYIEQVEHEFASYELRVSRTGLHTFSAPEGDHDDVVTASMLSIAGAFQSAKADEASTLLEQLNAGSVQKKGDTETTGDDAILKWANEASVDFDENDATELPDEDADELAAWSEGAQGTDDATAADEAETYDSLQD
jgi:hypothetical protein